MTDSVKELIAAAKAALKAKAESAPRRPPKRTPCPTCHSTRTDYRRLSHTHICRHCRHVFPADGPAPGRKPYMWRADPSKRPKPYFHIKKRRAALLARKSGLQKSGLTHDPVVDNPSMSDTTPGLAPTPELLDQLRSELASKLKKPSS